MRYQVMTLPFQSADNGKLEAAMNEKAGEGWRVIAVNQAYSTSSFVVTLEK